MYINSSSTSRNILKNPHWSTDPYTTTSNLSPTRTSILVQKIKQTTNDKLDNMLKKVKKTHNDSTHRQTALTLLLHIKYHLIILDQNNYNIHILTINFPYASHSVQGIILILLFRVLIDFRLRATPQKPPLSLLIILIEKLILYSNRIKNFLLTIHPFNFTSIDYISLHNKHTILLSLLTLESLYYQLIVLLKLNIPFDTITYSLSIRYLSTPTKYMTLTHPFNQTLTT